jgi:hypothetical protein
VRLIPKKLSIPSRRFRVLVDRQHDRLNMVVTPALMDSDASDLRQRFLKKPVGRPCRLSI